MSKTTSMAAASAPPLEPTATPHRFQAAWVGIATLAFFPGVYAVILRVFPPTEDVEALTASFIPYGVVFSTVSLGCFLVALIRARQRTVLGVVSTITAALLLWQLSWQAPFFVADDRPMTTDPITVLSLNLRAGQADRSELAAVAADADIVVLVEVTPWALQGLRNGPMAARFPYIVPSEQTVSNGSAIFSRYPLSDVRLLPPTSWQMRSAVADVPQIGDLTVVAAHPCNPFCGNGKWVREHAVLERFLPTLGSGPVIVAGDFNAIDDHAPMRRLYADGYESATDVAGAGWLPTYPSNSSIPPLLPIDHILLNDKLTASSVSSFAVAGTDHRGLRAVVGGTR